MLKVTRSAGMYKCALNLVGFCILFSRQGEFLFIKYMFICITAASFLLFYVALWNSEYIPCMYKHP